MAKSHYENIPLKIMQDTENYDVIYETNVAIDRFSKIYAKFSLKRTIINTWKEG